MKTKWMELNAVKLRSKCEEWELEVTVKRTNLQNRFRKYVPNNDIDSENFLFEKYNYGNI